MGCLFSLSSKGDVVPLRYAPGSGETGGDNPLSSARRTSPRRRGAGSGIKVRQSWTFIGNFTRLAAAGLSCLFRRLRAEMRQEAAHTKFFHFFEKKTCAIRLG